MDGRRATLAGEVNIDSEEGLASAADGLPLSNDGLSAVGKGGICRRNTAGVVLEDRAVLGLENLIDVVATTKVRLVQLNNIRSVKVGDADVSTRLATIQVVNGNDFSKLISNARLGLDARSQSMQSDVAGNGAVIGSTGVVLNLLKHNDIGGLQLVDNLLDDQGHMSGLRVQVLGVVDSDSDTLAVTLALEGDARELSSGVLDRRNAGGGQHTVKAKSVGDDTGDIANVVAHASVAGVLGAIKRSADHNRLGVGVCREIVRSGTSTIRAFYNLPPSSMVTPP